MLDTVTKTPVKTSVQRLMEVQVDRELSWLAERVKKGQAGVYAEVATITPAIANRLLEQNLDNRPVRPSRIEEISSDILASRWELNGEAIKVAKNGELNDGQHRLHAIVKANKPVQSMVIFGLQRNSRLTVDMGAQRTTGDFLGMEGAKYANVVASAAKLHNLYRRGYYGRGNGGKATQAVITKQEIMAEYWRLERQFKSATDDLIPDPFLKKTALNSALTAHVILHGKNKEMAFFFFQRLIDGANLKPGDPILALRNRLMTIRDQRWTVNEKLELILRHWNAWRSKEKIKRGISLQRKYPIVEG